MLKAVKDFLNQVYLEMNKVSWPNYSELRGSTYLIIIFFLMFAVFLFGVDWVIQKLVRAVL
ncbi:MAG: preprotein translocase subunit SecE [Candidatus Marinimicrobia bacterium]|jgi:preprotein translocase subunit SecE|nr:preprotein translocase subunit SecE [Candidatus Neomarinimicrobiota bacterium]MDG1268068.1 preprotein translocase subunit SecE [Candidatus Neomarinimicrobiota bacterium]MDG2188353.1 preprotein translocase subunit SecE [Candidatus Neomarinimicrobiota bacterium]|tara:strand:+ start:249 stop:431 length:183 start_codon:yes stop_codon:yes gene_type:complete